jgi:threonine dehydrogenase-like Zn-dependent dehydrogenase
VSGVEIVFSGKGKAELYPYEDMPLGPHDVRGRTLATLISPGTELAWLNGDNFPIRPGYAAVFEVETVGMDVKEVRVGERRFCMGGHRSTQQFEVQHTLPLAKDLATPSALIARLMGVSMSTLMTTNARPGDKVVVTGAGPVGLLAAHQFRLAGYEVLLVEPNEERRVRARESGLTNTLATMPLKDDSVRGRVALVVECSGHEQAVLDGCNIVRKQGEVVLVGVPWKAHTSILAHEILKAVFFNYVVLRSGWEFVLPLHGRSFKWEELYEGYNNAPQSVYSGFKKALGWLADGRVPLEGMMHTRSPHDPKALYEGLLRGEFSETFTVLDWV